MNPFLDSQINRLKAEGLYRSLKIVESEQGPEIICRGQTCLNFSSNNYLGLANHPALKEAAIESVKKYGTGSGASRLITGSTKLHEELEEAIASFKGTEKALVFNSGYHANIGIISSLMNEGDIIFSDELNHASLIDGCRLSKAKTLVYRHNDFGHLEEFLIEHTHIRTYAHRHKLILTETLFSMDGDVCHLADIMKLAEKYKAWVLVDEAHATGVFGKTGRGVVEEAGVDPRHPLLIQMGTLGKALGSFGAYVCGSKELIDFLINKARSFIYTTALPPAVLGASLAAINFVKNDFTLRKKLWENVEYFGKGLGGILKKLSPSPRFSATGTPGIDISANDRAKSSKRGPRIEIGSSGARVYQNMDSRSASLSRGGNDTMLNAPSPIIPLIIGDAKKTMELAEKLFENGIWAQGIRFPSVPPGTERIRLTLMATHTRDHLDSCLHALNRTLGGTGS